MAQKKLLRFAKIKEFENVHEYPENMAGEWHTVFKNENPIILELACGRGEYTVALADLHPDKNFIGVDVKGNRMYIGAKKALAENKTNAAFLRTQIEKLGEYFSEEEVAEIWITFPDPQLRISKAKKRLTHPRFLRMYKKILKQNGPVHLKTDSPDLYDFTKLVIDMYGLQKEADMDNAYASNDIPDELKIKTYYEALDIAGKNKIHYLRFSLPSEITDRDAELQQLLVTQAESISHERV